MKRSRATWTKTGARPRLDRDTDEGAESGLRLQTSGFVLRAPGSGLRRASYRQARTRRAALVPESRMDETHPSRRSILGASLLAVPGLSAIGAAAQSAARTPLNVVCVGGHPDDPES